MLKTVHTIADFNDLDLCITEIINVYFTSTDSWARPNAFKRPSDGLVLLTEGSITYFFDDEEITAQKGDLLIFPKGLNYSGRKNTTTSAFYVVDFYTDNSAPLSAYPLPKVYTLPDAEGVETVFSKILADWQSGRPNHLLAVKSRLYRFISDLSYQYMLRVFGEDNLSKVSAITEYIEHNFDDSELSIPELCKKFYLSESTLRRMMLAAYDKAPVQYIIEVRIQNAKNMLIYDNLSVGEISGKCGFASTHYFCRIFKQKTGMTPVEYRKKRLEDERGV